MAPRNLPELKGPLYTRELFEELSIHTTHSAFHSYKTWSVEKPMADLHRPVLLRTDLLPPRSTIKGINELWETTKEAWDTSPEFDELQNLEATLENTMIYKPMISQFMILGLGSMCVSEVSKNNARQLYFILNLIKKYVNRTLVSREEQEKNGIPKDTTPVRIRIDRSQFSDLETEFVVEKLKQIGVDEVGVYSFGTMMSEFSSKKNSMNYFVISITPDNPVRSIMVDLLWYLNGEILNMPRVMLCAPGTVEGEPSHPYWAGDETSQEVEEFLEMFIPFGFESERWKEAKSCFGEMRLHIAKDMRDPYIAQPLPEGSEGS